MAIWVKAPVHDKVLLQAYLDANITGVSASFDTEGKLQSIEIAGASDTELGLLMGTLMTQFPGCF